MEMSETLVRRCATTWSVCRICGMRLLLSMQEFNTALSWATRKGYRAIVKILLDKNADTEVKNKKVIWWCILLNRPRLIIGLGVWIR